VTLRRQVKAPTLQSGIRRQQSASGVPSGRLKPRKPPLVWAANLHPISPPQTSPRPLPLSQHPSPRSLLSKLRRHSPPSHRKAFQRLSLLHLAARLAVPSADAAGEEDAIVER